MSVKEQDAQRIALVATLATQIYVAFAPEADKTIGLDAIADDLMKRGCVEDAMTIIDFAEQAMRTPTGGA